MSAPFDNSIKAGNLIHLRPDLMEVWVCLEFAWNLVVDEKDVSKAQAKVDAVMVSLLLPGFLIFVRSLFSSI